MRTMCTKPFKRSCLLVVKFGACTGAFTFERVFREMNVITSSLGRPWIGTALIACMHLLCSTQQLNCGANADHSGNTDIIESMKVCDHYNVRPIRKTEGDALCHFYNNQLGEESKRHFQPLGNTADDSVCRTIATRGETSETNGRLDLVITWSRSSNEGNGTALVGWAFWYGSNWSPLIGIAISDRHQGRGLGKKLTRLLIREAAARDVGELRLHVNHENERAIAMYIGFGFEVTQHSSAGVLSMRLDLANLDPNGTKLPCKYQLTGADVCRSDELHNQFALSGAEVASVDLASASVPKEVSKVEELLSLMILQWPTRARLLQRKATLFVVRMPQEFQNAALQTMFFSVAVDIHSMPIGRQYIASRHFQARHLLKDVEMGELHVHVELEYELDTEAKYEIITSLFDSRHEIENAGLLARRRDPLTVPKPDFTASPPLILEDPR